MEKARAFSLKEAAYALRISDKSCRRLIERKELPASLVGGQWRIPRAALCRKFGCSPPMSCAVNGGHECELAMDVQA